MKCQFVVYQHFYCIQGDHIFHLKLFQRYKALLPFRYTTNLYLILFLWAKTEEKYLCCVLQLLLQKKYTYQPEKEIQLNIKVVVTNSS